MTTARLTEAELQAIEVCNGDSTLQRLLDEVRALRAERDTDGWGAERASLLESLDAARAEFQLANEHLRTAAAERDRLAADVARLREALQFARQYPTWRDGTDGARLVDAALASSPPSAAKLAESERDRLAAKVAQLREALDEATDAIDAVESEPGREGGPMFRIDWTRALKLVRDADTAAWLAERDAAVRRAALEEAKGCVRAASVDNEAFAASCRAEIDKLAERAGIATALTPAASTGEACNEWFVPFGLPAQSFIKKARCTLPSGHLGDHKWTAGIRPDGPPTVLDGPPAEAKCGTCGGRLVLRAHPEDDGEPCPDCIGRTVAR